MPDFTESRAQSALLRAAGVVDDPTLHDFARLVDGGGTAVRLALHDILQETRPNRRRRDHRPSHRNLQSPISSLRFSINRHGSV